MLAWFANIPTVLIYIKLIFFHTVLINSLFYPFLKIYVVNAINFIKTPSIPTFFSNTAFANKPIVFIDSDNKSELPYFKTFFIWLTNKFGIVFYLITSNVDSDVFPFVITYPNTLRAVYKAGFLGGASYWRNLSKKTGSPLN